MMKDSAKRQASVRLLALCLGTSAALLVPSAALGADAASGGTVRATIGSNGAVTSVKQVGSNGATSSFSGQLPVKMSITHTGNSYAYHVENTFSKTQTVHFTDTAGTERHTTVALQLPLVAQLGVDVPASMTNINATGATVTTGANGVRHLLWNMVLFSPLGSSAQDVTFTASGSGTPVAELRATPVDPSTAPGLSAKTQDKTAEFQQEDFWAGYASGGNKGLSQLSDGVGQILDGLGQLLDGASQLHAGLAGSLTGTQQAADGSTQLADGAKKLTAGLVLIHGGLSKDPTTGLTGGLRLIHAGLSNDPLTGLTGGLRQIHAGLQGKTGDPTSGLVPGLTAISAGLDHPTNAGGPTDPGGLIQGLQQISFGLDHPAHTTGPTDQGGLVEGVQQILLGVSHPVGAGGASDPGGLIEGVDTALAGLGDDSDATTLIGGVKAVNDGITALEAGIEAQAGCAVDILNKVISGFAGGADACATGGVLPPLPGLTLDPFSSAVMSGLISQFTAVSNGTDPTLQAAFGQLTGGLDQVHGGLVLLKSGLSSGDLSAPGIKEGLTLIKGGLSSGSLSSPGVLEGLQLLTTGTNSAVTGTQQLADGTTSALDGAQQLSDGTAKALAGSKQLYTGSGQALAGSRKLLAGSGSALDGSTQIRDGLAQLASGLRDGAKQFPQAVDGAGQIATGLSQVVPGEQQVKDGISQVLSGATGPLETQLTQASRNAHQQIAVLNAATALGSQAPGGAGTSYVLAQPGSVALAANTTASKSSSHTGRNAALIAIGGVLALVVGLGAGIAVGRQRVSA